MKVNRKKNNKGKRIVKRYGWNRIKMNPSALHIRRKKSNNEGAPIALQIGFFLILLPYFFFVFRSYLGFLNLSYLYSLRFFISHFMFQFQLQLFSLSTRDVAYHRKRIPWEIQHVNIKDTIGFCRSLQYVPSFLAVFTDQISHWDWWLRYERFAADGTSKKRLLGGESSKSPPRRASRKTMRDRPQEKKTWIRIKWNSPKKRRSDDVWKLKKQDESDMEDKIEKL